MEVFARRWGLWLEGAVTHCSVYQVREEAACGTESEPLVWVAVWDLELSSSLRRVLCLGLSTVHKSGQCFRPITQAKSHHGVNCLFLVPTSAAECFFQTQSVCHQTHSGLPRCVKHPRPQCTELLISRAETHKQRHHRGGSDGSARPSSANDTHKCWMYHTSHPCTSQWALYPVPGNGCCMSVLVGLHLCTT